MKETTNSQNKQNHYTIIVVGGGFCGVNVAKKLSESLGKNNVALIDTKKNWEYTPSAPRLITQPLVRTRIEVPYDSLLKKCIIIDENVVRITREYVKTKTGKYTYDHLVVCTGAVPKIPIQHNVQQKEEGMYTLKTFNDAIQLGNKLKNTQGKKQENALYTADDVIIVGGGLVGVEVAAEISARLKKHVTILEPNTHLLSRNHSSVSRTAAHFLKKNKCTIIYGERVVRQAILKNTQEQKTLLTKHVLTTAKEKMYAADVIIWCAGLAYNTHVFSEQFGKVITPKGLLVNEHLQVLGMKNVYCGGDLADIAEEKTAQNSELHAEIISHNILHNILVPLELRNHLRTYVSRQRPLLISLGDWNGILVFKHFCLKGKIPAVMKWLLERWEVWTLRRG